MIDSLLAVLVVLAPVPKQLLDQFGDSLPPGAMARMGTVRLRGHSGIERVVISPDGKMLATEGRKGLDLWDSRTGHITREIEFLSFPDKDFPARMVSEGAAVFAFSADSRKVHILTHGGLLRAFDLDAGRWSEPLARVEGPAADRSVGDDAWGQVSSDGSHFVYTPRRLSDPDKEPRVEVLAIGKSEPLLVLKGKEFGEPDGYVRFSRDNKLIAVRLNDGTIKVWELETKRGVATTVRLGIDLSNFDFTPDGKTLAACYSGDKTRWFQGPVMTLVMWDVATGKELSRRDKWEGFVLGFTQDGKRLLSRARGDVIVTETETWNQVARLGGHRTSDFPGCSLSLDTSRLVTCGGRDGSMIIWDVATAKPVLDFDAPRGRMAVLAFSPDSQTLLTGNHQGQTCWLWDVPSGKRKHTLEVPG